MRLENTTSRSGVAAVAVALITVGIGACSTPPPAPTPPTSISPITSSSAPSSSTVPDYPPPYIDHVQWMQTDVGASLAVYPTTSGRLASAETAPAAAWREVIALAPAANTPTMHDQFDCHWNFARAVEPDKPSWNLEPARPVVSANDMIAARCNPGAAEESTAGS